LAFGCNVLGATVRMNLLQNGFQVTYVCGFDKGD